MELSFNLNIFSNCMLRRGFLMKILLLCGLFAASGTASADEFAELKQAVHSRAAAIGKWKTQSLLEEGAAGFLIPSPEATAEARLDAEEENKARLRLFGLVARQTGNSVDHIARRFVEMAASESPPPLRQKESPPVSQGFVPVTAGSSLPLKVLARPRSPMHRDASESSAILQAEVPAFSAWVVLARREGWYQLAEELGQTVSGWMKESDVMEWKHHMVVSFTHPGNRSRNLIFREKQSLVSLLGKSDSVRQNDWERYLEEAGAGRGEATVGMEPEGWLREKNQFYLLPILDQQELQNAGQEVTLLKVAAATRERANEKPAAPSAPAPPMLDIVFVMDLTRSMGPFVTSTLQMLGDIAASFQAAEASGASIRFGFWGYRDDPKLCKGIEFSTNNFTPSLQDVSTFLTTLGTVDETKVDSIDYAEDVFAGVADAISQTKWREGAVRTILLVGDAPGRAPGEVEKECRSTPKPKGSSAGMDESALRALADSNSVYLAAYYLESSKWKNFTALGVSQFKSLTLNPGSTDSSFGLLNADNPQHYHLAAEAYASRLAANIKRLAEGDGMPAKESPDPDENRKMADNLFRNAFIEWNSANTELEAPRDVEGWMTDKDPVDPSRLALEPGVLLTKTQLSELRDRVNDIIDAMLRVEVGGQDFFKELHAVVTIGGRDPGRLRESRTLMDSNHFPDFLSGLPYKSKIMGMSKDDWREMGADQANQYRNEIVSKVAFYSEIYKDASKWQRLNAGADSGEVVTPIPIDMLP